jgi:catechol 2,3-dioxygenase-like lactoylglutathione lyase family enzyme
MRLDLVSLIVRDYDEAIAFFVGALGFDLVEDSPSLGGDGRAKRWVVVRPPDATTGLLLSEANSEDQRSLVGAQFAGRVGFVLRVEDFDSSYFRMSDHGVVFVDGPRIEPYGKVAIFVDLAGNKWDLIGPL